MQPSAMPLELARDPSFFKEWRRWGQPLIPQAIHDAVNEPLFRPFVAKTIEKIPGRFIPTLLKEYHERGGQKESNAWLRDSVADAFGGSTLSLSASDDEIRQEADRQAVLMRSVLSMQCNKSQDATLSLIERRCEHVGVKPPQCKTTIGAIERVSDPSWWRRSLRRQLMRQREHGAIKIGLVSRNTGLYVSDETLHRTRQSKRKSMLWMENTELINELGEIFNLTDLAQGNVSNPEMRRIEMFVRIKGQDDYAKTLPYEGLFLTWTTPSRMHATSNGRPNPKYDGTNPKEAHQYLGGQWAKARSALDKAGIHYFGVRIAEPHHDGTPHWHMLVFVSPLNRDKLLSILAQYALQHDADEPGATKHRFTWERIDPNKGSAIAYVAKYVSKNIDGKGVGLDFESGNEDAATTTERVAAWANVWHIRQFQFFGDCPVTIYRNIRKIRQEPELEDFIPYWKAADAGDWHSFTKAMREAPLKLWTEEIPSPRYSGETISVIHGVELNGKRLETRQHTWILRPKSQNAAPWIHVNNCTQISNHRPDGNKPFKLLEPLLKENLG